MKRLIGIFLLLLICLTACTGNSDSSHTAEFYYLRKEIRCGTESGVIVPEKRNLSTGNGDLSALLALYLAGSQGEEASLPLPAGSRLVEVSGDDQIVELTFSGEFSDLEGMELTLVCACISRTVFSLTDAEAVSISAPAPADGTPVHFTADRNTFLYYDDTTTATDAT